MTLDNIQGTAIIISKLRHQISGRMVEHLRINLPDPNSAIVFIGNQLNGTINCTIQEGEKTVMLKGRKYPIAVAIHTLYVPDKHLDREPFMSWLSGLKPSPHLIEMA